MENELYDWLDDGAQYERHDDYNVFEERMLDEDNYPQADIYTPGGMARERYYDRDDYEEEEEPEEDFGYFGEDGLWD